MINNYFLYQVEPSLRHWDRVDRSTDHNLRLHNIEICEVTEEDIRYNANKRMLRSSYAHSISPNSSDPGDDSPWLLGKTFIIAQLEGLWMKCTLA